MPNRNPNRNPNLILTGMPGSLVSQIDMKCEGKDVEAPSPSHVEDNKCVSCPDGFTCDNKKKTKCDGARYVTGNVCKACPKQGYTCKDGKKSACQRSFGIRTAMAWNTLQKNHDVVSLALRFGLGTAYSLL